MPRTRACCAIARGYRRQRREERRADPRAARGRDRAAHRPPPGRANPRHGARRPRRSAHRAGAGRQSAAAAGRRADRSSAAARLDRRGRARPSPRFPRGSIPRCCCAAPTWSQAEYQLRAANAQIGAARAALFPRISLTGLLGFASNALTQPVQRRRFACERRRRRRPTRSSTPAPARQLSSNRSAARCRAVASYQSAIQTAFREVADALARPGHDRRAARAPRRPNEAAAADARPADRSPLSQRHRQLPR